MGQARKKGGLRYGSGKKRGVFTAAHTCTRHIVCECALALYILGIGLGLSTSYVYKMVIR